MSTRTVFTLPERYLPADPALLAWVTEQGIDPKRVVTQCFRVDQDDDGALTLYYLEFDWDADGNRIIKPRLPISDHGDDDVYDAPVFAKTIRAVPVASIPTLTELVSR